MMAGGTWGARNRSQAAMCLQSCHLQPAGDNKTVNWCNGFSPWRAACSMRAKRWAQTLSTPPDFFQSPGARAARDSCGQPPGSNMKRPITTYTPGEPAIHLNSCQKRCHYWARHASEGRDDIPVWLLGSDGNRRPSAASVAVIKQMRPPIDLLGASPDHVRTHHFYIPVFSLGAPHVLKLVRQL
jgi:hypothetical protein